MPRPTMPRLRPPLLAAVALLLVGSGCCQARLVHFDNTQPMRDRHGQIMDAHDGTVQRFGGKGPFYMHTVSYGLCKAANTTGCDIPPDTRCGFRLDHNVSIYSSHTLASGSWRFEGHAFDYRDRPPGTLFRPCAVFNPNTREYVLWWNYVHPNGTYAGFAAATADSPVGPFRQRVVSVNITYERADVQAGDLKLFVDDDGAGYVIYGAGFWITIEKLTPDFLSVTGEMFDGFRGNQSEWGFEAPVMFKRRGLYYILFGPFCCFCYQGSGVRVYTARSPLGPYTFQGRDIACRSEQQQQQQQQQQASLSSSFSSSSASSNSGGWGVPIPQQPPYAAEPTPGQGCLFYGEGQASVTRAQQNFVIEVPSATPGETHYLWTGDRWMQSPDGLKGHEPQFWAPLQFDADGRIEEMVWVDRFALDVDLGDDGEEGDVEGVVAVERA